MQLLDDAAVEVLHGLAVAVDLDHAVGDHCAVERRHGGPYAEAAEEDADDRPADDGRAPGRADGKAGVSQLLHADLT